MDNRIARIVLFLIINFAALGLGAFYTGDGVASDWYQNLNKAPWTPPGWVFGAAWTSIMICFAIYMSELVVNEKDKFTIAVLFGIQWILNVSWNPIFFKFHWMPISVFVILALSFLIGYFLFRYKKSMGLKTLLILPYFLWMLIASSLNIYAFLFN